MNKVWVEVVVLANGLLVSLNYVADKDGWIIQSTFGMTKAT